MSSLLDLLYRASMGCFCSRETVVIEGKSYTVLDHLAEGGFSNIDLVEDKRTGTRLALKRIVCHSTEDQIGAQREVEFHRHLEGHPAVIRCEGSAVVGAADIVHNKTSEVMILLPYYPRGTLHDELAKRAATRHHFTEDFALKLFQRICDGVMHMHSSEPNPLAHRDLKPHNVLLTADMRPVIMDLGSTALARVAVKTHSEAQRLQDEAAEKSSMPYRPPELFQSLGCLLYAICFFSSPYDSVFERGDSVALAVQSHRIKFPSDSPYSTDVHNLISWMLTPEMAVRPHLRQITDRLEDMVRQAEEAYAGGNNAATAAVVNAVVAAAGGGDEGAEDENATRT